MASKIAADGASTCKPQLHKRQLRGVNSIYDVARAVEDSQNYDHKMLKAYIRDWPTESEAD